MNTSMEWSWFEVPVKVKQINEYLISDTVVEIMVALVVVVVEMC